MTRELVYGRRAVREALRGRREVLELWATERRAAAEPWLRARAAPRTQIRPERELTEAAGTRDHQGVVAWCEPYRYADAWVAAAEERPLIVCLVSSDATVLGTSGQEVAKLSSGSFVTQLDVRSYRHTVRSQIADRLSPDVRTHLERWRRERR